MLPPASPYIIYVIQFLRVAETSSSIQQVDCRSHPQRKTSLQTRTGSTPTEVTTGVCMANMHTHMQKTFLPSPVSCQDVFSKTHIDTGSCILHRCSIQPPPPPHPLRAATLWACACESGCGLQQPPISNPPLWVVREMKALGVHYKTTTAAAGDRPPGATNYPFSSFHPHLFAFCPSISQL